MLIGACPSRMLSKRFPPCQASGLVPDNTRELGQPENRHGEERPEPVTDRPSLLVKALYMSRY